MQIIACLQCNSDQRRWLSMLRKPQAMRAAALMSRLFAPAAQAASWRAADVSFCWRELFRVDPAAATSAATAPGLGALRRGDPRIGAD
jgi:hypothetical protein